MCMSMGGFTAVDKNDMAGPCKLAPPRGYLTRVQKRKHRKLRTSYPMSQHLPRLLAVIGLTVLASPAYAGGFSFKFPRVAPKVRVRVTPRSRIPYIAAALALEANGLSQQGE